MLLNQCNSPWTSSQQRVSVSVSASLTLKWTLGVTRVTGFKESVDVDQREHGDGAHHGAQLHHRSAPHQGAVALVPQNDSDDDLDVGQAQDEQDPRQNLQQRIRGGVKTRTSKDT